MRQKFKKKLKNYSKKFFFYTLFIFLPILFITLTTLLFAGCTQSLDSDTSVSAINEEKGQDSGTLQPQDEPAGETSSTSAESVSEGTFSLNEDKSGNFAADGTISDDEYSGYRNLDGFEIYWANDNENIYFAIKAQTEGYVAIGIQPGRMMKDADMIYGYVDVTGAVIFDMFSTGNFGPHPPDEELGGTNDILEFGGSESGGYTIIEFQRQLITGDQYDNDILPGINKVIWAYGSADSPDGSHSRKGYGEIEVK